MRKIEIMLKKLEGCEDIPLPKHMTPHSAGMDIFTAVKEEVVIEPGKRALLPTGIAIALPPGIEAQIRPRSGLAIKNGIGLLNSPGTIDADYRGEVKIGLVNLGPKPYTIQRGDRVAQLVVAAVQRAGLQVVAELDTTQRQTGGFGHTGK